MDNYVAPEIPGFARQILQSATGARTKLNAVEWSAGGLFNKVFALRSSAGDFILKIECGGIACSLRKEQIENEVLGAGFFREAGIPCPAVVAHDLTGDLIGAKYVLTERIGGDILWGARKELAESAQAEIRRQADEVFAKMNTIISDGFGSLSPDGILKRHATWESFYKATFRLLIRDSEALGVFTDEELAIVREAATKVPVMGVSCKPTFVHGDMGDHNAIWGGIGGGPEKLYIIDFGNAVFSAPHEDEFHVGRSGGFGLPITDITKTMGTDRRLYQNLLEDFQRLWWTECQRQTEDYAHCLDWMDGAIRAAKADTSRSHVTAFVEKCKDDIGCPRSINSPPGGTQ